MTQRHTVEIWTNVRPTLVRSVLESDLVRTEQVARYLVTLWILRPWIFRVKTWLFRFYSSCLLVASRTRCRIGIRDGSIFAFSIWQILVELSRIESINFNFVCFDCNSVVYFCFFASIALLAFGLFRVFQEFFGKSFSRFLGLKSK